MKPCHTESRIAGVMNICNRPHGHAPPHVFELFMQHEAHEPVGFSNTIGLGIVDPVEALKKIASGCTTDPAATAQHALDSTLSKYEREAAEERDALWRALGCPDKLFEIAAALTSAERRGERRAREAL